jgi:predicted SnoaL-like aldol condensation-catalyzing enzyme
MPTNTKIHTEREEAKRQTVVAFYEAGLNRKDFDAARQYFGPYYRQHNPNAADGIEGFQTFVAFMRDNSPHSRSEIKSSFVDTDFVILHVHKITTPGERGVAIVDIFRLEDGKIVEHWDVSQTIPEHTVSGNAMF